MVEYHGLFFCLKSSSKDVRVFLLFFLFLDQDGKKKVPYTNPNAFDHFAGHLRRLCLIVCCCKKQSNKTLERSTRYFLHHLDPDKNNY